MDRGLASATVTTKTETRLMVRSHAQFRDAIKSSDELLVKVLASMGQRLRSDIPRLDAERAREVLGQFFAAASEELLTLRGRSEKFIGDAVMAVFGLPHVHEDDALRAVRAGLAILARTRRLGEAAGLPAVLEVRIGIESGEAAIDETPAANCW